MLAATNFLLQRPGVQAATHWMFAPLLREMGVDVVEGERVVRSVTRLGPDREDKEVVIFTGGGVTAGIDFAFAVVQDMHGDEVAQGIQLALEYFAQPPAGLLTQRPEATALAESTVKQKVEAAGAGLMAARKAAVARITAAWAAAEKEKEGGR